MPRTSIRVRHTALVAALAALAFLPPSGWQVCVGADGHWAIEPPAIAGVACCDEEPLAGPVGATATDDCSDCTDYTLSGGAAVGSRPTEHGPDRDLDATCVTPAALLTAAPAQFASPLVGLSASPPHPTSGFRSPILRC